MRVNYNYLIPLVIICIAIFLEWFEFVKPGSDYHDILFYLFSASLLFMLITTVSTKMDLPLSYFFVYTMLTLAGLGVFYFVEYSLVYIAFAPLMFAFNKKWRYEIFWFYGMFLFGLFLLALITGLFS